MDKSYYPLFLDIEGRTCVVIGGGDVAERKAEGLRKAGARVTIVSPKLNASLSRKAKSGALHWVRREYRAGDLQDATMAFAGTNDRGVNRAIAKEAEERRVLLNVADDPELCSFIAPAVVERDGLSIAVSTGGKSPAMARKVREELERLVPPEYGLLLEIAAQVREELREQGGRVPGDVWQQALSPGVLTLVRKGRTAEAKGKLLRSLSVGADAA